MPTITENEYEIQEVTSDGTFKSDPEIYNAISGDVKDENDAIEKIKKFREALKLKVNNGQDNLDRTFLHLQPGDIISNGKISYKIKRWLYTGGFGIAYIAESNEGLARVIKEFCPNKNKAGRYVNSRHQNFDLEKIDNTKANEDYNKIVDKNIDAIAKFIKEPARLLPYYDKHNNDEDFSIEDLNIVYSTTNTFIDGNTGNLYYAMTQVKGETLRDFMSNKKKNVPFAIAMDIMKNLIEGVRTLHDIDIIHQDLSHSNVMIHLDKSGKVKLKVIDLGSAFDCSKSNNGLTFMPTETQGFTDSLNVKKTYFKNNNIWSKYMDIYSLGVILFYLFFYEQILKEIEKDGGLENKDIDTVLEDWMMHGTDYSKEIQTAFQSGNVVLNAQLKMVVQLVKDAVSLDESNKSNPFQKRPATLDEFKNRLEAIEKVSKEIEKDNVTVTNLLETGVEVDNVTINKIVEYSKDDWFDIELVENKVIVTPNSTNGDMKNVRSGKLIMSDEKNQLYEITVTQTAGTVLEWHDENPDTLVIPFDGGGTKNVYIKTNKAWTAQVDKEWAGLQTFNGDAGDKVICELHPTRNMLDTEREATLIITCTEDNTSITKVLKQPTELAYIKIRNDGGLTSVGYGETHKKTVTFSTNFNWGAEIQYESDEKDWIRLDKVNGGPNDDSLNVTLSTNHSDKSRKATIILTANGATAGIYVSQTECPQKPKESEKPIEPVKAEDIKLVEKKILSNGNIEVIFDASSNWQVDKKSLPGWIKVTPNNGLKGKNKLTIIPEVNTGDSRQAEVLVTCANKNIAIPVQQKGKKSNAKWWILATVLLACVGWLGLRPDATSSEPALRLMNMSDKELEVSYNAEDLYIAFEAGDKWKCEVLPAVDWLSVDKTAGAAGQTTLTATVKTNCKFNNRQANLLLTCGDTNLTLLVTQGYDKVASLQQNLGSVEFSPFFQAVDESGNPITFNGEDLDFDKLIKNQYPDYRIGITHDIVNYEKDKKNRISKLILKAK